MSTGTIRCLCVQRCVAMYVHVSMDIQMCLLLSIGSHKCLLVSIGV